MGSFTAALSGLTVEEIMSGAQVSGGEICQVSGGQAKEAFKSFILCLLIWQHLVQQFWQPMGRL